MSWLQRLARPEIVALEPYAHAAWEPGLTRLHANELPWRSDADDSLAGLNHYPEPQPAALRSRLAALYEVPAESLLLCRGSDEAIDLLVRSFCRAERDAVLACPPTFGMYAIAARIQGAQVIEVPLRAQACFALDPQAVLRHLTPRVKLVFLCSPNNPTGNRLDEGAVLGLADALAGRALLIVDEAYVEFTTAPSLASRRAGRPQLVLLRTLSKAHGFAGARLGCLIADPEVIALLRRVIAPYAIAQPTLEAALRLLRPRGIALMRERVVLLRAERERLRSALSGLPGITQVRPSEANFLLVHCADADAALARARRAGLLLRDVRSAAGLGDALRVSVGTAAQNAQLIEAWA